LVRQRKEVQALPRRLTPLAGGASRPAEPGSGAASPA
jgi:hypothetical protein